MTDVLEAGGSPLGPALAAKFTMAPIGGTISTSSSSYLDDTLMTDVLEAGGSTLGPASAAKFTMAAIGGTISTSSSSSLDDTLLTSGTCMQGGTGWGEPEDDPRESPG